MRLSDAIATGQFLMDSWNGQTFCGCAIAAGVRGAGKVPCEAILGRPITDDETSNWHIASNKWLRVAETEWPWITEIDSHTQTHRYMVVSNWFFSVQDGEMTLDELIDRVRAIEPAEQVPATEGERGAQPTSTPLVAVNAQ